MKKLLLVLPLMFLLVGTVAQAADPVPLPTNPPHTQPPFVYHYDPLVPVIDWVIAAGVGPAGAVGGPFADALAAPPAPWHWETEWLNPGAAPLVLNIIWRAPGMAPLAGILTVPPLSSAVVEIVFGEIPEVGGWRYTMTPGAGNPLFHHDASVCEADLDNPGLPPELDVRPVEEIELLDHVETVLASDIPTVSTWGLIILVLLLLTAATFIIRRRRVEA